MQSKLYILTITLNDYLGLRRTVQSVVDANIHGGYIHIIKNGAVGDESSEYIRSRLASDQNLILVERSDQGIYDAMNQALCCVPIGAYFICLNSGDMLSGELKFGSEAAYLIPAILQSTSAPIQVKGTYLNGMPFCHQSLVLKKGPGMAFNSKYLICGDYHFILIHVRESYHSPRVIPQIQGACVIYDGTGISSTRRYLRDFEGLHSVYSCYGVFAALHYIYLRFCAYVGKISRYLYLCFCFRSA